jgi:hypothetical protein
MTQYNAEDVVLYPNLKTQAVSVSVSGTTAANATALATGRHRVVSTIDVYLQQGTSTIEATAADSFLPAGVVDYIWVNGTDSDYLAGITDGGTGTLFITLQQA